MNGKKLSDYLNITEAAEFIGVSTNTLRNWEAAGKIVVYRHPVNNYRLFDKRDLEAILNSIELVCVPESKKTEPFRETKTPIRILKA